MDLVARLADAVIGLTRVRDRVLVAIDGPDAAGKTTLADRLAMTLPVPTLRASIDDFHQPRQLRYRRGDLSAEGYYRDSFDDESLARECLVPFLTDAPEIALDRYDYRTDRAAPRQIMHVPARAVLVVDGVFLLREPLRPLWTFSIYLHVSPEETLRRALVRDEHLFGSPEEVERRYRQRYLPGQALYRSEANPRAEAHVVVRNDRADAPTVERWEVP